MTPPYRVCLSSVTYPPQMGGVAVAVATLARTLTGAGYLVHVFTQVADPSGARVEVSVEDRVHVHRCFHPDPTSPPGAFELHQAMQRADAETPFDLLHGYSLPAAYPLLSLLRPGSRPRPLVASILGTDAYRLLDLPPSRALLLPVLRKATWVTSVNHAYLERVAEDVSVAGRSSVVRHGIAPAPPGRRWSLSQANRGVVGTVGEFRRIKDIPLLVRAYGRVPEHLRTRLLLAGFFNDIEEEEWANSLIDELDIAPTTELTGPFDHRNVAGYMERMHVYVQASADEGLPLALLEAASLGVPLVATAVGGMREVLTDGVSGRLVPHGDPGAMAAAISGILADDGLAMRLADGARRLSEELSDSREAAEWLALYARLLRS